MPSEFEDLVLDKVRIPPFPYSQTNELGRLILQLRQNPALTNTTYAGIPLVYTNFPASTKTPEGYPMQANTEQYQSAYTKARWPGAWVPRNITLDTNAIEAFRKEADAIYGKGPVKERYPLLSAVYSDPALNTAHVLQHEVDHTRYPSASEKEVEEKSLKELEDQMVVLKLYTNSIRELLE